MGPLTRLAAMRFTRGANRRAGARVRCVMGVRAALPLLALAAVVLAGCGGPEPGAAAGTGARLSPADARLLDGWRTDARRRAVPLSEFRDGGPPRDGIPPIDRPRYVGVRQAERFLTDREPVIAVSVAGRTRAYPIRILVWHEIVNDRLGGRPIVVSYCPLCNSALVFDRQVGDRTLDFGTTGKLRRSDLVMWDRQTESWWQQFDGQALVGSQVGRRLQLLPSQVLSWRDFRERHPRGSVLSQQTGFRRDYGRTPYPGYERPRERPFLYDGRLDGRLPPKERVVLIRARESAVVVPFSALRRDRVAGGRVGGRDYVVLHSRDLASPLDAETIADARDVGGAGVFVPRSGGRPLTFTAAGRRTFRDRQTRSTWDVTGRAVAGPLRGRRLTPLVHDTQFWFAVAAFVPDARIAR